MQRNVNVNCSCNVISNKCREERRGTECCHRSVKKNGSLTVDNFLLLEDDSGRLNLKSFFFGANSVAFRKTKIIRKLLVK